MKKLISLAMLAAMVFSVACKSNQNKEQAAVNADSVSVSYTHLDVYKRQG